MKKSGFLLSFLSATLLWTPAATAQNSCQSDFFLGNNLYSYRINPASCASKSFFGLGISNLNLSAGSNIGIGTLLFPAADGNGLVTGFHPSVSSESLLNGLQNSNNASVEINENILSLGIKGKKSYNTFEINARALATASIPKEIFAFIKNGSNESAYDLSDIGASAQSYLEFSYGYSRDINSRLRIGSRIKLLAGIAGAYTDIDKALFKVNADEISYELDGRIPASCAMLDIQDNMESVRYSGSISPSGYGLSLDLGAEYKLTDALTLSASITDLGAVSWNYNAFGWIKGSYSFKGIEIGTDSNYEEIAENISNEILENITYDVSDRNGRYIKALPLTANIGAKYTVPGVEILSAGVLSSFRLSRSSGWFDVRGGGAITPCDWFSLSANIGVNSFGGSFGAASEFRLWILDLSAGIDGYLGRITEYKDIPLPVNPFRMMLRAGATMAF